MTVAISFDISYLRRRAFAVQRIARHRTNRRALVGAHLVGLLFAGQGVLGGGELCDGCAGEGAGCGVGWGGEGVSVWVRVRGAGWGAERRTKQTRRNKNDGDEEKKNGGKRKERGEVMGHIRE